MTLLFLLAAITLRAGPPTKPPVVIITTSLGEIQVKLDPVHAPITTENFLRYVDLGHYQRARFHRTVTLGNQPDKQVKIEVIQGGVNPSQAKKDFPPIKLERTSQTGILHKDGTISMARDGADTATSDFFICVGDQPQLDFGGQRNPDGQGFAAFGRVTAGMDIVRKIQRSREKDQTLTPPIIIVSIKRARK